MMRKLFPFFEQAQQNALAERNTWHILPGRLTFVIGDRAPLSSAHVDCFTTDHSLVYRAFNNDFGPLNMSMLYKFCEMMLAKMHTKEFLHGQRHLVYYSHASTHTMENAAYLMGSFATLYLHLTPEHCRDQLNDRFDVQFNQYRDAGFQSHSNTISLYDCFCGLQKAQALNFFNFPLKVDASLNQVIQQSIGKSLSNSGLLLSSTASSSSSTPSGSPFQENVDFNQYARQQQQQQPMESSPLKGSLGTLSSKNNTASSAALRRSGQLQVSVGAKSHSLESPLFMASTPNPYRLQSCAPFDADRYEYLEDVGHGDMSWLIPGKFLALATPRDEQLDSSPGNNLTPEQVMPILHNEGVKAVVRLNNRVYDRQQFLDQGFKHYDLFFPDCTIPPEHILAKFLKLAEQEKSPMAVHCRAGLGRTGTLIAAYMIKHFKMTAREAIAYIRVCRPGSIIGAQQDFLEGMESRLMNDSLQLSEEEDAEHAAARLRAERIETENEQQGGHAKRLLLGNTELKTRALIHNTITPYASMTTATTASAAITQQQQQPHQTAAKNVDVMDYQQTRYQLRSQQQQSQLSYETKRSLNSLRLSSTN